MTDKTLESNQPAAGDRPINRRRLLKVAVATAPIIATLPSGAALARSSNLIGPTTGSAKDLQNRTLCLERGSLPPNSMVDLGTPPKGWVTAIPERDYRKATDHSVKVSEKDMCKNGGQFHYKQGNWRTVKIPKGIAASATALSSFVGGIYTTEV